MIIVTVNEIIFILFLNLLLNLTANHKIISIICVFFLSYFGLTADFSPAHINEKREEIIFGLRSHQSVQNYLSLCLWTPVLSRFGLLPIVRTDQILL